MQVFAAWSLNPRKYKQIHTPTVVEGGGGEVDGTPPWSFSLFGGGILSPLYVWGLIRILVLLQRKTLLETKSRTLKCLKRHFSTVRSMKNVAVLTENRASAFCFRPYPGGFDSWRVPTPGNLPSQAKKDANARGSVRGRRGSWAQLELTDALPLLYLMSCDDSSLFRWISLIQTI